jgi:hypothetical protein
MLSRTTSHFLRVGIFFTRTFPKTISFSSIISGDGVFLVYTFTRLQTHRQDNRPLQEVLLIQPNAMDTPLIPTKPLENIRIFSQVLQELKKETVLPADGREFQRQSNKMIPSNLRGKESKGWAESATPARARAGNVNSRATVSATVQLVRTTSLHQTTASELPQAPDAPSLPDSERKGNLKSMASSKFIDLLGSNLAPCSVPIIRMT